MPIYEFFCPNNRRIYSFFARSMRYADKLPRCPDNPKWTMERMISGFAITGRAKQPSAAAPGGNDFDDAKMEAAMGEMEREFGSIADSDNPDTLEEEYGDVFDAMDQAGGADEGGETTTQTKTRRRKRITRDPTLYEMGD